MDVIFTRDCLIILRYRGQRIQLLPIGRDRTLGYLEHYFGEGLLVGYIDIDLMQGEAVGIKRGQRVLVFRFDAIF